MLKRRDLARQRGRLELPLLLRFRRGTAAFAFKSRIILLPRYAGIFSVTSECDFTPVAL